jgi:hypothetical protein
MSNTKTTTLTPNCTVNATATDAQVVTVNFVVGPNTIWTATIDKKTVDAQRKLSGDKISGLVTLKGGLKVNVTFGANANATTAQVAGYIVDNKVRTTINTKVL